MEALGRVLHQAGAGTGPRPVIASNSEPFTPTLSEIYFDEEMAATTWDAAF